MKSQDIIIMLVDYKWPMFQGPPLSPIKSKIELQIVSGPGFMELEHIDPKEDVGQTV